MHEFARDVLTEIIQANVKMSTKEEEEEEAREVYSLCDALKQLELSQLELSQQDSKELEASEESEDDVVFVSEIKNKTMNHPPAPRNAMCRLKVEFVVPRPTNTSSSSSSSSSSVVLKPPPNPTLDFELSPDHSLGDLFSLINASASDVGVRAETIVKNNMYCLVLPSVHQGSSRGRTFRSNRATDQQLTLEDASMYPSARVRVQKYADRRGSNMQGKGEFVMVTSQILRLMWRPVSRVDASNMFANLSGAAAYNNKNKASPIAHLKNVFGDQGLSLMRKLSGMDTRNAARGRAPTAGAPTPVLVHNNQFRGHGQHAGHAHIPLTAEANAALDMFQKSVQASTQYSEQQRLRATECIKERRRWFMCQGLVYGIGLQLPRHIDAVGSWVVLFSLGLTTKFYVDGETITFQSGDALVFHASGPHTVMHGVEDVIPNSGPAFCRSGGEFAFMQDRRISVQLRQAASNDPYGRIGGQVQFRQHSRGKRVGGTSGKGKRLGSSSKSGGQRSGGGKRKSGGGGSSSTTSSSSSSSSSSVWDELL